ncbi:hypothetical protein FIE12Z_7783 [Fusarium flagelliforme]|uniref:Uncharacterized protein n=1 Tax=Fusarium flagelliforme TaxID=2675880 RepID=A0A395MJW4_9HYPO|nr:hypothetical protein FIE12Z_7783 [Fusarium flagelliforme]
MPKIVSNSFQQRASNILPSCQRTLLLAAVETAIYNEECSDYEDCLCDSVQSLAIFVGMVNYAQSQCGKVFLDPLDLMEEYHFIEYKLLTLPHPIQSHTAALESRDYLSPASMDSDCSSDNGRDIVQHAKIHIQISLRIAGLFYLRLVKGGTSESLHGPVHMLRTLLQHLDRVAHLPAQTSSSTVHGYSRSALIWTCLVADLMLWASINEGWKFHEHKWGSYACHDFLLWGLGGDDIKMITDRDLALCRILDLGNFRTGTRDPRTYIQRILAM